ncbi:hypothetical protein [Microbacterium sp.]|uniref:hypothetical protein n=1 Tax=Microbacterium sp. TaxID=51671 RepID=UPI0028120377|nr:hypothetical protein [Microbacterium sp.]
MFALGVLAATVGAILFHVSLGMTLRANSAVRVPFRRNAAIVPPGSIALRAAGAGLLVLGAVLLSTESWFWPLIIVVAGPVTALVAITIHNRDRSRHDGG